ncbi:MAG: hypothetical protein VCB25_04095, partial [Myxococcota bacterium]
ATAEVLEEEAAKDKAFARVLRHQKAFRKQYARWQTLAYPARTDQPHSEGPSETPGAASLCDH